MEETSAPIDVASPDVVSLLGRRSDSGTLLSVMVGDSQGNEIEVDLNVPIDGNRVMVRAGDLIFSGSGGRYRFSTAGGTVVVYNPETDNLLNEMGYEDVLSTDGNSVQNAFGGRLSEHVIARALMMGELIPEYGRVTMLSNIVVVGHGDFESGQVYGGYLVPARLF